MTRKETYALSFVLLIVGLIPYLLDKRGTAVPMAVVDIGGIISAVAVGFALFFPLSWVLTKLGSKSVSISSKTTSVTDSVAVSALSVLATLASVWWVGSRGNQLHFQMPPSQEEVIYAHNYFNETVELDGKNFDHCHFTNVRFLYEGMEPTQFTDSTFEGRMDLESDNDGIKTFAILGNMASAVTQHPATLMMLDPHGNATPIPNPLENQEAPNPAK